MSFFRSIYLTNRFFTVLASLVVVLCFGMFFQPLFWIGQIGVGLLTTGVLLEFILLYQKRKPIDFKRELPNKLSNGDMSEIPFTIKNRLPIPLKVRLLEDFPEQLQLHDWSLEFELGPSKNVRRNYPIFPVKRGEYSWGNSHLFIKTTYLQLAARQLTFEANEITPCYPSFEQFKDLRINALVNQYHEANGTMIRKIGQSLEFEQIKKYVPGDDFRHINWKASAKQGEMMLNQYQEERSQDIYCVLDLGRSMQQPFENQTLLDYSINAALALTKTILAAKDKAGLITFSAENCQVQPSRSEAGQFRKINEQLYNITSDFQESGYERLYRFVRYRIRQRGLFVLFTNFDTIQSLRRNLPYLRAISTYQLVLVVIFENNELNEYAGEAAGDLKGIYDKTMARHLLYQNKLIARELATVGIQSLITRPENLTIELINSYLAIKKRQMF